MTFTISDPVDHVGTYLCAAAVVVALVLARRVRFVRGLLTLGLLLGLTVSLATVIEQRAGLDPRIANLFSTNAQEITGTEMRVPLSRDGHFWVRASLVLSVQRKPLSPRCTSVSEGGGLAREVPPLSQGG